MRSLDSAAMHVPPVMREIVLQNDHIQINRDSAVQYLLFPNLVAFDSIIKVWLAFQYSCTAPWLKPAMKVFFER